MYIRAIMLRQSILRFFSAENFSLKISTFTPHELSRVILRAVKEKRSDTPFWKSVIARVNVISDQLQPYDISVIVYGLGRMRYRDRDLLMSLAARVIPSLSGMSLNDISHLLSGFARVEVRNDLLFDLASREIGKKLNACKSLAEVANIMCSYVSLNYEHPLLFSALSKRTIFLLPLTKECSSAEIAKLVDSFSRSDLEDPRLFALLASEFCRRVDELTVNAIAGVAHAYSRRGLLNPNVFLTELILDECFKRRAEFDPVSISNLLDAIVDGKSRSKISLLADYFTADLSRRGVGKFDLTSIALLASALGRYHVLSGLTQPTAEESKLFMSIGDRVANLADQIDQGMIAKLVQGFADVGVRHGPLLFNMPDHVKRFVGEMPLPELGLVFRGYARLSIRNDVLLECVPPRVIQLLNDSPSACCSSDSNDIFTLSVKSKRHVSDATNAKAVLDLLESLAILTVSHKHLADSLLGFLDRNKDLIPTNDLLERLPKCVNALMLKCPQSLLRLIKEKSVCNLASLSEVGHGDIAQLIALSGPVLGP